MKPKIVACPVCDKRMEMIGGAYVCLNPRCAVFGARFVPDKEPEKNGRARPVPSREELAAPRELLKP